MPSSTLRRALTAIALLVFLFPALAAAQEYVVSSGVKGGNYHSIGARLTVMLLQEPLKARHEASAGSLDNLNRLGDSDHPANVVIAQADAVRYYLDEHPAFAEEMVVLDDLGRECVALITSAKTGISSAADLRTGTRGALIIPSAASGAAVTYEYMSRMDPAYRKSPAVVANPIETMLKMRLPDGGQIAALMMVKQPRTITPELDIVLANQDTFKAAPIRPADVKNGKLPDGSPVYTFETVRTGFGVDYHIEFETMCTRAMLLTSSAKLDQEMRRDLSLVLLQSGRLIAPGR